MAMAKKGLIAAAVAFAATPQGRQLMRQAKDYVTRPENRQRAQQMIQQARSKGTGTGPTSSGTPYPNGYPEPGTATPDS